MAAVVLLLSPIPVGVGFVAPTWEIVCIVLLLLGVFWIMATRLLTPSLALQALHAADSGPILCFDLRPAGCSWGGW